MSEPPNTETGATLTRSPGTKSGFVAIVGAPNVGKSTLLNRLVGSKVSIVSPKVQTTRSRVLGICIENQTQVIFIDTPGIFEPKRRLDRAMVAAAWEGLDGADATLLVIDASTGMNALNQAREFNKSVPVTGLVITKLDGTSRGGMVVAIQHELDLPVKFIGLGEQPDDLQPFSPAEYARALFFEE